jgi:indole-3-glycerol phosphate synthase
VQASSGWTPPTGTLGGIVAEASERAAALTAVEAELARKASAAPRAPSLAAALRGSSVAIIAEVKRRSPSKGWIRAAISAVDHAREYEVGGAAAISVLTEPVHFGGSSEDLVAVRGVVRVPVLKKDFHIQPVQLVEARALGASAALLIVRALSPAALRLMTRTASDLHLEILMEVRDEMELDRALDAGATMIGVNNRNLETLEIDAETSERLIGLIPDSIVAISESGVSTRADVERIARFGADAILVGSAISAAADPAAAVRKLSGVQRASRGR